jgi:hypothetical protein
VFSGCILGNNMQAVPVPAARQAGRQEVKYNIAGSFSQVSCVTAFRKVL